MSNNIIQGSTPTHTFNTPYPKSLIEKAIITYKQGDQTVLEKKDDDVTINDYSIVTKLSQKETLSFDPSKMVCIQIKVKTIDGDVVPSNKLYKSVDEVLNKDEI